MKCIVNVDLNWGIGHDNDLLVSLKPDLKRFRDMTIGKAIVYGRNTLSGFPNGKVLKRRTNIVLSRSLGEIPGAITVGSIDELFDELSHFNTDDVFVVGGEAVYLQLLPYCNEAFVTKSLCSKKANRFFPNLEMSNDWISTSKSPIMVYDSIPYYYEDFKNMRPLNIP